MSAKLQIELKPLAREHVVSFCRLVVALAEFEKLPPPEEAAQARLVEDALGPKPRIEVWLAFAGNDPAPCGYMILVETYSSFLALPTLYLEDLFVLPERRNAGVGGALLKKAVGLAHERGCGRMEWTALDWNVNAQQVYEQRLGAKRMSEWLLYRMNREDMTRYLSAQADGIDTVGNSISE
ncbi:MAG TPA: GNAT family N-acetyltransferase [Verrucomicrobiales bacterium]|nr:GNAT family N-acetyltransferase [Verrucomicrobiales bacterium]